MKTGTLDLSTMRLPLKMDTHKQRINIIYEKIKSDLGNDYSESDGPHLITLAKLTAILENSKNQVDVPRGYYRTYISSNEWKRKSRAMRDYFKTCAICNSTKKLCVHHKHYDTVGHERLCDIVVLCGDHHWEYEEKRMREKEKLDEQ